MKQSSQLVIVVQRIGPHHHARFEALARMSTRSVAVVETRPKPDVINMWKAASFEGRYRRVQVTSRASLLTALEDLQPVVIVCVGYSDPEIHSTMLWAFRNRACLITCSDSTFDDQRRILVREGLKRIIVSAFSAGLVAGGRSHAYIETLGLEASRRFSPWDVVDNHHFERGANESRDNQMHLRQRRGLPSEYFFFVGRFIPEKNLYRLIDAYGRYHREKIGAKWPLLLSGAGPFDEGLREYVRAAGLDHEVRFLGFIEYDELPVYYGLASVMILASVSETWGLVINEAMAAGLPILVSSRCGCAPDLVHEDENGFTFDPENVEQMAERMSRFQQLDPERRLAMGQRSRQIIANYAPEAFACGLNDAINCALEGKPRRMGMLTRLAVRVLAGRKP